MEGCCMSCNGCLGCCCRSQTRCRNKVMGDREPNKGILRGWCMGWGTQTFLRCLIQHKRSGNTQKWRGTSTDKLFNRIFFCRSIACLDWSSQPADPTQVVVAEGVGSTPHVCQFLLSVVSTPHVTRFCGLRLVGPFE